MRSHATLRDLLALLGALTGLLLGAPDPAAAQARAQPGNAPGNGSITASIVRPVMQAGVKSGEIRIDGHIDEAAWQAGPLMTGFVQSEPGEGVPASRRTDIHILFDDEAMYVAARMWDSPDSIRKELLRRDERGPFMDWIGWSIDPERDGRTGYEFRVNAAGVQQDLYVSDDTREDGAWNAVWESAVSYDPEGWSMEARLPLSQIRFPATSGVQTWGINFHRRRAAAAELTHFSLESRRLNALVSQFGSIEGVQVPASIRHMEARPYVLSSFHNGPATNGDPFFDGNDVGARVGSDFRVGLGSAFTLDGTVNPDFGQVEADPAVINLTAFETRFEERRPFFVEDAQVFDFALSGGSNQLYYSRRIGRPPHLSGPSNADFLDIPEAATIVGAGKITGRKGGLSMGMLGSVTRAEHGEAFYGVDDRLESFKVEPRTAFGVASVKQDFRKGLSQIGMIATGVRRDLPSSGEFTAVANQAFTGGARFDQQWDGRRWKLFGFLAGSRVEGSPAAMIALQRNSIHYFQRPDATRARVDSSATSLMGAEWRLELDRQNTKNWTGAVWSAGVTKGFDVNDLGFTTNRERIDGGARLGYRELTPGKILRDYNFQANTVYNFSWEAVDHAGDWDSWRRAYTNGNFSVSSSFTFLNYKTSSLNLGFQPDLYSRTATRGGPVMIQPGNLNARLGFGTDRRQPTSFSASVSYTSLTRSSGSDVAFDANVTLRPSPRVQVTLNPNLELRSDGSQYVATYSPPSAVNASGSSLGFEPTFGRRYLFGDIEQTTFGIEARTNYTISPKLSVQLYAQPLLSSGDYTAYKQLSAPSSFAFRTFQEGTATPVAGRTFCAGGSICRDAGGTEYVDFNGDGAPDYTFADKDFNVRSLIGNAVLRWEYRPGSAIFVVWQRSQDDAVQQGDFAFRRDLSALVQAPAHNRFIVKVNYWLGL